LRRIRELLATAEVGRLYREGAGLAIVGRPNVGKSSLFNALLRDARAIVTSIPGTTRDLLEEVITIQGVPVRISDTAGLRHSTDEVERIGMERAREALCTADMTLLVLDSSQRYTEEDESLAREVLALGKPAVIVLNKCDLPPASAPPEWATGFHACLAMSAKLGTGLKDLENTLGQLLLGDTPISADYGMLTRIHQRDSLRRAAEALERLLSNYTASPEFLSIDLRDALQALGEITGDTTPEDVLNLIFSQFCIGK
ncbi:MAG: GTP-binding protein, partial [Candidatus Hydrogenedentes bacterium]|nr:GTP-binding protein [Candidatus Hydrogenedentota bacterium]